MKLIGGTSKSSNRKNNVIDFSKKKRDLSHIQSTNQSTRQSARQNTRQSTQGPQSPKRTHGVKRDNKIKVNILKVLSVVALILLLTSSVYVFLNSQYALIQRVVLTGNSLLEKQGILSNLPIEGQANFYKTSKEHFKEPLKDNLWIKTIEVDKNFFTREVYIAIEERRPLFRTLDGTETSIIDEDGMVLPNLPGISTVNVPFVIGTDKQEDLKVVIDHLKEIPDHFLYEVSEVNVENMNSVTIYTMDGFVIRVGVISNLTLQRTEEIVRIMQMQRQNKQRGTIDIRGHNIIFEPNLEG